MVGRTQARGIYVPSPLGTAIKCYKDGQPDLPVALKIGIHHGTAIAVTMNGELDYCGQTVNIAARVQALAGAREICVTSELGDCPGVEALLADSPTRRITAEFKGMGRPTPMVRVDSNTGA